jgi:hypothetical protein
VYRIDVTGLDLKLGAVVATLGSSSIAIATHTVDHANLSRMGARYVITTTQVQSAS